MDLKSTMTEYHNGDKVWYRNGLLHRADGPAVEYANGDKVWYLDDKLHREDGPAIEYANGEIWWCIDGEELTLMEFINHDLVSEETAQKVLTKWI